MRASLTRRWATPSRRDIRRGQRALRSPLLWGRFAERGFDWFARMRSSVACCKGLGQEVIKHFGAGLGSVAHAGGDLRTDRASIGLARTETLEIMDCGRRRREGVGGA